MYLLVMVNPSLYEQSIQRSLIKSFYLRSNIGHFRTGSKNLCFPGSNDRKHIIVFLSDCLLSTPNFLNLIGLIAKQFLPIN